MWILQFVEIMLHRWINLWTSLHWGASMLIFFTAGWWWRPRWIFKYPDWMVDERLTYLRYGFFPLVVLAILAWGLSGFRGLKHMAASGNLLWATVLVLWGIWTRLSYGADTLKPEVALSSASQLAFVIAFALSLLCNAPPKKYVVGALTAGMLFLAMLSIAQSAMQKDVNLRLLDKKLGLGLYIWELELDPHRSGASVVQSEGIRFLRPYGLTPHPNMLAGTLVMGLCAGFYYWLIGKKWAAGLIVVGLWALLLTFSRAAIGGFGVGVGVIFSLLFLRENKFYGIGSRLKPTQNIPIIRTTLLVGFIAIIFIPLYFPLLSTRTGIAAEGTTASVEQMSIASRAVYIEQAWQLIEKHQWRGVGIGNFAWHSALLLKDDWRDLRGDQVHNIYLLVMVETGYIGMLLFMEVLIGGAFLILGRTWRGTISIESICLFGGVVAWLALGWFDHYPVTQMGYQLLFWGSFAVALAD